MRTCPNCGFLISLPNTRQCARCGLTFYRQAQKSYAVISILLVTVLFVGFAAVLAVIGTASYYKGYYSQEINAAFAKKREYGNTSPDVQKSDFRLRVKSKNLARSSEKYIRLSGEVLNLSDEKLENIFLNVTLYDVQKNVLSVENGSVEVNPLQPSQVSPFLAVIRYNPKIDSYKLTFTKTGYGEISVSE